jgi:hypothetical protein
MRIPIDDSDSAQSLQSFPSRYRHVVDNAVPHRPMVSSVMPGRTNQRETFGVFSIQNMFHNVKANARGSEYPVNAPPGQNRFAIKIRLSFN